MLANVRSPKARTKDRTQSADSGEVLRVHEPPRANGPSDHAADVAKRLRR
jgi:hypothetical protein